jgi:cell division protein FtsW
MSQAFTMREAAWGAPDLPSEGSEDVVALHAPGGDAGGEPAADDPRAEELSQAGELTSRPALSLRKGGGSGGAGGSNSDTVSIGPIAVSTRGALVAVIVALCGVGLVMVLSASAWTSLTEDGSVWSIFLHQALWMGVGGIIFFGTAHLDYRQWRKFRLLVGAVAFVLCALVLVPHIGVNAGGSSRWIGSGFIRLQPSELMKLAVCVFGADLLTRREALLARSRSVVLPLLSWLALACGLLMAQPDMGTAIIVALITFSLLFAAGVPMAPIAKTVGSVAVICVIAGIVEPYRRDRLLSFLNPFAHSSSSGYQVVQSLVGIGSGQLFGLGLGAGREKWGLLPNPHTDFIFSVIGEETGLVGGLLVLGLFLCLGWLGLRAARRAPDRFAMLLAVGITCWIMAQAFINIGAVIDILPVTGIPLPFVSFGGSSLVITLAAAGILVNISSQERRPVKRPVRREVGGDRREVGSGSRVRGAARAGGAGASGAGARGAGAAGSAGRRVKALGPLRSSS